MNNELNTQKERMNFATELLSEIKLGAKRWFIIAIIELLIILGIIGAFLIAESQTGLDTAYDISQQADNDSSNTIIGGNSYGGYSESEDNDTP